MTLTNWIDFGNVVAQLLVAGVAIWAVITSLRSNDRQLRSSDKQVKEQIEASNQQLTKQLAVSDLQVRTQIEESRRLATEEHQHQSRPILAPQGAISHNAYIRIDQTTLEADEDLYIADGRIDWTWLHGIVIPIHNMGRGPTFNIHCLLHGPDGLCQNQFVSWDNGPIEEKGVWSIGLNHSSIFQLAQYDSLDGKHPLYDIALDSPANPWANRIACLTTTYHDLFGRQYVSIYHYTLTHHWIHVATTKTAGKPPLDLKALNTQKRLGPKLSAPPAITS